MAPPPVPGFTGHLIQPGDRGYDDAIKKWAPNAILKAKFVAECSCAQDIAAIIAFARAEKLEIGVRSGGHNTSYASSSDGILIDLRGMRTVTVSEDKARVRIQGGATIDDIDKACIAKGVSTTGGDCSTVGIGGFATGGGINYQQGEHGLAVDNVVEATVVLADGSIVKANKDENPDLYWGIRGGGSNFGIVSEFVMKCWTQRKDVYWATYIFALDKLAPLVAATNQFAAQQDPRVAMQFLFTQVQNKPSIMLKCQAFLDKQDAEKAFKVFQDIYGGTNPGKMIAYEKLSHEIDRFCFMEGDKLFCGARLQQFDVPTLEKAIKIWTAMLPDAPGSLFEIKFFNMTKTKGVAVNAMAYAQREGYRDVCVVAAWPTKSSFGPKARDAVLALRDVIQSSSPKAQETLCYPGFADTWCHLNETDEWARKLFGPNYARLQEIKSKYDPDMIWNRWFMIQPDV